MNTDNRPLATLPPDSAGPDLATLSETLRRLSSPEAGGSTSVDELIAELDRLVAWLNGRIAQTDALLHVAEQVAGGMLFDDVLDRIYVAFKRLIPYDRIGCALLNETGTKLKARWARTEYPDVKIGVGFSALMKGSSLECVLESRAPRIINDLEAYLELHPDSLSTRLALAEGIRSSLTCPLIAEDKPVGFLFFSSRAKGTYRDAHQEVFLRIAGQVSLLVERSRLMQRVVDLNQHLQAAQGELIEQARRDSLTGLLNHGAIVSALSRSLAGSECEVAAIMVDVDRFKRINDLHGHLVGDEVLRSVVGSLAESIREADTLGRFGGEEFLVVLPGIGIEAAIQVAERMRARVAESVAVDGIPVTVSAGVADSRLALDAAALIALADGALYRAKEAGRNRVVAASPTDR
ncbi:MAG: GGDEF domain-containing protein [Fimbriimonadaceae bacterium]|nr:GGDEF domain-containing protein [Fimbriimonadaceae bacterium]